MEINKQSLFPDLIFNNPIEYSEAITLYPVKMKNIIKFQQYQIALTMRKNSIFQEKHIIKMEYLDFIKYSFYNYDLANEYGVPFLPLYYDFILKLFIIVCGDNAVIKYNSQTLDFSINGQKVTNIIFDDLRKIILLQNDIDFDIDEFINIDTVIALEKAQSFEAKKNNEKSNIEDYIDSLIIDLKVTEDYVSNLTIRKFWRYIKRIKKHEDYQTCYTAQMGGMVKFKEPIKHWMTSIDIEDKYNNIKTNEDELRSKIQ